MSSYIPRCAEAVISSLTTSHDYYRHTSTALVWLRMGSAHYVGLPIWTAMTCGAVLNLSMCLMALLHSIGRLSVVWLNRLRRV
ncbi:hypothetical protein CDAR_622691 [Caerostris darwini]|uniref:Uncharacterized protein n=1 Tax=Caerostris darwini TaxID=1538125 RepID=A0AAV4Q4Y4_9ARAC|nr:hypothetical protein CDAR_622691 [Caerostris darwini]